MKQVVLIFISIACLILQLNCESVPPVIAKARIESCPGCSLNRLLEVKDFIYKDVPKYENIEFKKIQGAPPELVLLNAEDEEIERIKLGPLNREECNKLLVEKGLKLKENAKLEL